MSNPLLAGPFAPLRIEFDCPDLALEGGLPAGLEGTLYRIGPNPRFEPRGPYNPLQGDGMVHAFHIADGKVSYRNRWVRTSRWRLEHEAGRALFATTDPRDSDPAVIGLADDGAANTNLVWHAGRLLALEEGHAPIALDPAFLETLGRWGFGGNLPGAMTAHPKIDPETGEMLAFANFPDQRFDGALLLHTIEAGGALVRSIRIVGPYPALVHDFAITPRHVLFVVSPLTLSLERLRAGRPPIAWEPKRGGFVGVMPRRGGAVRWLPAPPGMVWHLVNAFEDDGRIQIDLCRQDAAAFPTADGQAAPAAALRQQLTRWTVDTAAGTVSGRQLNDVVCEYPRIDERRAGLPYQYAFVAAEGGPGTGDLSHRALGRCDLRTGEMRLWRPGGRRTVSEPVFVAREGETKEGSGWLLATVYDEDRDASAMVVLDAEAIESGPVAVAQLDHRVPAGFHGIFVPRQSTATV